MRFIGDTHSKWDQYLPLTEGVDSIQVGDFGIGFREVPDLNSRARFIRGNHDSPELARNHPNWIKDGLIENDMMLIGGAFSIDREWRTEGVDWWADEELTMTELQQLIDIAIAVKPRVIVTHDCPACIIPYLFPRALPVRSRSQQAFDALLLSVKPTLWIFGHWHLDRDVTIDGTRFICLDELSYIDVDLDTLTIHENEKFKPFR
jgi:hypothetical protein